MPRQYVYDAQNYPYSMMYQKFIVMRVKIFDNSKNGG